MSFEQWFNKHCGKFADYDETAISIYKKMWQDLQPQWTKPSESLPKKPGLDKHEHVDCLVSKKGEVLKRPWNCESWCWDTEDYDDWYCNPLDVDFWMLLPKPPELK